jgi:hypothetical protein
MQAQESVCACAQPKLAYGSRPCLADEYACAVSRWFSRCVCGGRAPCLQGEQAMKACRSQGIKGCMPKRPCHQGVSQRPCRAWATHPEAAGTSWSDVPARSTRLQRAVRAQPRRARAMCLAWGGRRCASAARTSGRSSSSTCRTSSSASCWTSCWSRSWRPPRSWARAPRAAAARPRRTRRGGAHGVAGGAGRACCGCDRGASPGVCRSLLWSR